MEFYDVVCREFDIVTKGLLANPQRLTRALDEALRRIAEFLTRGSGQQQSPETMRNLAFYTFREPVVEVLRSESVFQKHPKRMINMGTQASGFSSDVVGEILLKFADLQGPEAAVKWLCRVLATTEAEALCIVVISGVRVRKASTLTSNIDVLPFDRLPASYNKQTLGQPSFDPRLSGTQLGQLPTAALLSRVQISPFFIDSDDLQSGSLVAKEHERLASVARVLTVLGPCAPTIAAAWTQFSNEDLRRATLGEARARRYYEVLGLRIGEPYELPLPAARRLVAAYIGLAETERTRFDIALDRINQAVRRVSVGDKAIDAAIALESLLLKGEQTEITFRLTLRAALLLGGAPQKRFDNRAVLKAFYDLRSKTAHGSAVPAKIGKRPSEELTREALQIAAKVVRTLIELGSTPDWVRLELGDRRRQKRAT